MTLVGVVCGFSRANCGQTFIKGSREKKASKEICHFYLIILTFKSFPFDTVLIKLYPFYKHVPYLLKDKHSLSSLKVYCYIKRECTQRYTIFSMRDSTFQILKFLGFFSWYIFVDGGRETKHSDSAKFPWNHLLEQLLQIFIKYFLDCLFCSLWILIWFNI